VLDSQAEALDLATPQAGEFTPRFIDTEWWDLASCRIADDFFAQEGPLTFSRTR